MRVAKPVREVLSITDTYHAERPINSSCMRIEQSPVKAAVGIERGCISLQVRLRDSLPPWIADFGQDLSVVPDISLDGALTIKRGWTGRIGLRPFQHASA